MPRIPTYDNPQVRNRALPGARQRADVQPAAFGGNAAKALGQLGDIAQGAANAELKLQMRAQQEADEARVNDAFNRLRERELELTYGDNGYTNLKGIQALDRPDNMPLSSEYAQTLEQTVSELSSELGNDRQRQAFMERANNRLTEFRGSLMRYEGEQSVNYQSSVADGTILSATNELASFYNNPDRVAEAVQSIRSAAFQKGRLNGLSAVEIEASTKAAVSKAHIGAVDRALATGNPLQAEAYLRQHKDQFTEGDLVKARSAVKESAAKYIGTYKAEEALNRLTQAENPTDLDRVVNITMDTESSGRRYDSEGNLLTSPAGAQGEMQVMPHTAKDPGYGVTPAQDDSPEELARVGREYLTALIREYEGDLGLAWAAYNYGPSNLEAARKEAEEEGNPGAWFGKLPEETRNYVRKNLKAYAEGSGRPKTPTYQELLTQIEEDPDLQARPEAMAKAREALDREWTRHQKARKQVQDNAFAKAMQHIENGGSYDTIPPSVQRDIDPNKWNDLRRYESTWLNGGRESSDLATYQMLASNPDRVREMSDSEFYALRTKLSPADFKSFAKQRGEAETSGTSKEDVGSLNRTLINYELNGRLQSIGLDPKADSGAAAARVGAIRKHINDVILMRQESEGRKFTDAEIRKVIDEQFLRTRSFRDSSFLNTFTGGLLGEDGVRKLAVFGTTVGDIPTDLRKQIEKDLEDQGFEDPTDQQVLEAFFMGDLLNR